MREIPVELTPQALAQIRRWLLLLAGDDTAPAWDPGENHDAPESLQAAAQWLVDNGHGGAMDDQLVAVLLALFSINLRWKIETEIEGRFIPQGADNVWLVDLDRLARDCALTARSPSAGEQAAALAAAEQPSLPAPGSRRPPVLAEDESAADDVHGQERMPSDHRE
jgi:hypothetical protein